MADSADWLMAAAISKVFCIEWANACPVQSATTTPICGFLPGIDESRHVGQKIRPDSPEKYAPLMSIFCP